MEQFINNSTLKSYQARQVFTDYVNGTSASSLAKEYGVKISEINGILFDNKAKVYRQKRRDRKARENE